MRWSSRIEGAAWEYGADYDYLEELCRYWKEDYDWRKWEGRLKVYPHFFSNIDGVDIHFWHILGKGRHPFPVLLLHGWPGSAFEFFDTIELLTDPGSHGGNPKDALDVIIPDLPDFGWSGKPCVPGGR
ncbi:MAG: epoxide hydrolase 1 [Eubacterium sp.]|nr:epoxide hydrolase 1 [Eubacterium sp.]